VGRGVDGLVLDERACRDRAEIIVVSPIPSWTHGPGGEPAAAIRTDIADHLLRALRAEGAFETANACVGRIGWQRLVAMLAGGPQGQGLDDIVLLIRQVVFATDFFFGGGHGD